MPFSTNSKYCLKLATLASGLFIVNSLASQAINQSESSTSEKRQLPATIMKQDSLPLTKHLQILADPSGKMEAREVLHLPMIKKGSKIQATAGDSHHPLKERLNQKPYRWHPNSDQVPNFTFSDSVYWVRFKIKNPNEHTLPLILEVAQPLHDYIDFFLPDRSNTAMYQTGDRRRADSRPITSPTFAFPLELTANSERTVLIRFAAHDGLHEPMHMVLWQRRAFEKHNYFQSVIWILSIGTVAILGLYNFFVFLILGDRSYLYGAGFMLTGAFFSLALSGLGPLIFWPNSPWWANHIHPIMIGIKILVISLFARSYLMTKKESPRMDNVFLAVASLGPALILGGILLPFAAVIRFALVFGLGSYVFFAMVGWFFTYKGHRPARYFLFAFGIYFTDAILLALKGAGLLPANILTEGAGRIGSPTAALILSLGIADRINLMRHEREVARKQALEAQRQKNTALAENNKRLRRLDQLKDEFLANTSHELRTPLNGIIGITDSLIAGAAGTLSAKARENLQLISAGGRRLANLVNDVLDFSRLRHGDIVLQRRPIEIDSIIQQVLALSQPLVEGKPLTLVHEPSNLPAIYIDENRIEQVLHNLISNAIKFTKEGMVVVSSRLLEDQRVEVTVADTGIGIPPEKQELIFESFTQADGSVAREYGGTGLGLSISRHLIQLHGGKLYVESSPGEGAHFIFTLPTDNTQADFIEQSETEPGSAGTTKDLESQLSLLPDTTGTTTIKDPSNSDPEPATERKIRVLIVDDDPVNLRVLRNQLELYNHTVVEAMNGKEALNILDADTHFDLLLLDVMMPGLSGYEVCRIVREKHSESELPIIMLTAKNRISDKVAGLESGANDYLIKPFEIEELSARVRTMIRLREAARSQSDLATLQSELELARKMQQSLLPTNIPNFEGLQVAVRYRSMLNVGGDYYDINKHKDGLGILLADVSGHGVAAALIVSIVKIALWFERQNLPQPAALLQGMNSALLGNIGRQFVTACHVFVDPKNKIMRLANAGHPPLLIYRRVPDGDLTEFRPFGRIMGIFEDGQYEQAEIPLQNRDRVLVYTDGVIEARGSNNEQFGLDRLKSILTDTGNLSAEDLAEHLMAQVIDWSGGVERIDDDVAFIIVDVE